MFKALTDRHLLALCSGCFSGAGIRKGRGLLRAAAKGQAACGGPLPFVTDVAPPWETDAEAARKGDEKN